MKSLKSFIPNAISFLNLNSGVIAVLAALDQRLELAVGFILLGIFFDFFDGMAARSLNAKSQLGVQLDSFADLITSGLAPSILVMQLMANALLEQGHHSSLFSDVIDYPIILSGLFVVMGSAYRLGVFNIDETQSDSFVGLPTPANAILISSLVLIQSYQPESFIAPLLNNSYFLLGISLISAILLNAPLRLMSFKFKSLKFNDNKLRYLFLVFVVVQIVLLKWTGVPLVIVGYLLLGKYNKV